MLASDTMSRRGLTALLVLAALAVTQSSAQAEPVADAMRAELQAAGVPAPVVSVATPGAASSADVAAFDADPALLPSTLSYQNLLSPDPTNPLPVATVTFGSNSATRLAGFLQPPGIGDWLSTDDPTIPIWRLEVVLAMRHRLAAGNQLAGVAMQPQFPNYSTAATPDLYLTPPPASEYPATLPPAALSASDAANQIQSNLPTWARTATVAVVDWTGGERRATIRLAMPALGVTTEPTDLAAYAMNEQRRLNEQGAVIGSVTVRVDNLADQSPMATFAGDATWGQHFLWVSPLLRAYVTRAGQGKDSPPADSAQDSVDALQAGAGEATGVGSGP